LHFNWNFEKGPASGVLLDGGIAVALLAGHLVSAAAFLHQFLAVPVDLVVVLSEGHFIGIDKILPVGGDQLFDLRGYFLVDLLLGGVVLQRRVLVVVVS